ncbi:hypothetical protein Hanom_Chr03g00241851 [Helianthus anomalus]
MNKLEDMFGIVLTFDSCFLTYNAFKERSDHTSVCLSFGYTVTINITRRTFSMDIRTATITATTYPVSTKRTGPLLLAVS